jgi:hypothetical protein
MVSSDVEAKVARSTLTAQTSYYTGQSDAQKRVEAEGQKNTAEAYRKRESSNLAADIRAAELKAAEVRRQDSALAAARRMEAAAREAQTPAGQAALKLKAERDAKLAAEQAAHDAEQSAKSIAYWNKRWGKS